MLDMGFIPDVEKIVGLLPRIRQTLMFSATITPEVRRIGDAFLINPREVYVAPSATTADTVDQGLAVVAPDNKREALRRLIGAENVRNAIIFCNRKKDVDILYKSLKKHGMSACALHGDMTQSSRFDTLEAFKRGEKTLLVASDVAARGLDIFDLSHVFNFDVPTHAEDYVHRIGRTGRAGRAGRAITLATPEETPYVDAIVKLIGKDIPRMAVPGMDAPALEAVEGGRRGRGRGGRSRRPAGRGHRPEKPRAEPAQREPRRDRHPDQVTVAPRAPVVHAPIQANQPSAPRPVERDNLIPMERRRPERKPERERDEPVVGFGVGANVPAFMFAGRRAR
jgi:superfamily II DNA/RNA helicase